MKTQKQMIQMLKHILSREDLIMPSVRGEPVEP